VFSYVLHLLFTMNRVKRASIRHLIKSSLEVSNFLFVQDSCFGGFCFVDWNSWNILPHTLLL